MISAFEFSIIDANVNVLNWIIRILIAAGCGFAIGWERKSRSKEAGIRTHTIVCLASALMMLVSKYGFEDLNKGSDAGRIAAQVVSGIGFLGAGIIFYKRDFLHGLTTAAGIWATSGIGLTIGSGMIVVGVVATGLLVLLQILLHRPLKFLKSKTISVLKMTIIMDNHEIVDKLTYVFGIKKFLKFKTTSLDDGKVQADIEVATETNFTPKELYEFAQTYDFIKTLEKIDEL